MKLLALLLCLHLCPPLLAQTGSPSDHAGHLPAPTATGSYVPETSRETIASGTTPLTPIQTELVAPLDISRLHPGSPVLTKLSVAWSGHGCRLAPGSILAGHIAEVDPRTRQNRISRVTLLFDTADCNGLHSSPFPTSLVAVLAGTLGGDPNLAEGPPLVDAVGLSTGGGARSASDASFITDRSALPIRKLPAQVLPGQVVGLSRIKLSVGSGLDGGSVLSSPNHDVRLEATTHLVLMPRTSAPTPAVAASSAPPPSVPAPNSSAAARPPNPPAPAPAPEPVDETEICASACNSVADVSATASPMPEVAAVNFSAAALGYRPRENREITALDFDSSLTYLDARNLLFTFDPHKLREHGGGIHHESARTVRAALIDAQTHTVKHVADWRVYGDGQYIWSAGPGVILAHIGHQLRLLTPDLAVLHSADLSGSVAWVSASPSGNRFAVGVYRERHSDSIHQEIFQATGEEPEEDIDVHLFDADLHQILVATRSSEAHRPILSDLGEIRIAPGKNHRWQISEVRWDRSSHLVVTTSSSCRPSVTTSLSGLLFVVGCDNSGVRWYRMLHPDGRPVLKAVSPSQEIQQAATSSGSNQFAVRVIRAVRTMSPGQPFRKSDLQQEEISIYRTSDGRRLFATSTANIPLAEQSFALSPDGNQLALLGDSDIAFYPVTAAQ